MLSFGEILETVQNYLNHLLGIIDKLEVVDFFILCIVVLTTIALFSLMRVRWFYKREQKQLVALKEKLEELERQPLKTIHELKKGLLYQKRTNSLVYKRVEFILKLAKSGKINRIQATADMMPPEKFTKQQSYFAHFVISVLLIIGLAGTLWAFEDILINSGLTNAIENGSINSEKYTPAIERIYEGLQSAMLASLAGIFGTIFLLLFKFNFVQPTQERFFSYLDWVTEFYLIPLCSQFEEHEQLGQILLQTTKKLSQAIEHAHVLAQKLSVFTSKTENIIKEFERITNKESHFYQASTQLFGATKGMGENYAQLSDRIGELVTEHTKSVSKYETYVNDLQKTQESFTASQNQLVTSIGKIPRKFEENVNDYTTVLGQVKTFTDTLKNLIERLESQQIHHSENVEQAAENMMFSLKKVNDATEQLEKFTMAVNQQAQLFIPELTKLNIDPLLHQYVEELKNSLEQTQQEFIKRVHLQQETMQKELNQIDSVKQIEQAIKEIHELLKQRNHSWFSFLSSKR